MKRKILIADFSESDLKIIQSALKSVSDYSFSIVKESKLVVEFTNKELPDVILIDSDLSDPDGIEITKQLKKDEKTRDIPIILLSNFKSNKDLLRIYEVGITDYIRKPINKNELLLRLNSLFYKNDLFSIMLSEYKKFRELSLVASKAGNSLIIFNAKGEIEWVNEGFQLMYEYSLDEFKKEFGTSIYETSLNPEIKASINESIKNKGNAIYENEWTTKSGIDKWIQTTLTPVFDDKDELDKLIAIETDITSLKIAEAKLEEKNEHLLTLTEHLEGNNELLDQQRTEIEEQKGKIEEQKKKSDKLLLNILPFEIAEQLKKKGYAKSKSYKMVSVLFTDFISFSKLSEHLSTQDLIKELSTYFEKFDEIIEDHYIEKIKTIGDAYMCAGGLPLSNKSNPIDVTLASLKIQMYMASNKLIKESLNEPVWELRLGIHTGDVMAGVIGKKKFAYDIWGDSVNIASRMESSGEGGKVNISGATYEHIKEYFDCTYRGKIEAKNIGEVDMYFVNGLKRQYCKDLEGVIANEEFMKELAKL